MGGSELGNGSKHSGRRLPASVLQEIAFDGWHAREPLEVAEQALIALVRRTCCNHRCVL